MKVVNFFFLAKVPMKHLNLLVKEPTFFQKF